MIDSDSASRHLHVIRSLMERATIYRALSAPTALVGGLLSLGGFATAYYAKHHRQQQLSAAEFLVIWLVILLLTCLTNGFFLWRDAKRRGEPFFSAGMRCAAASLAPPFICAGILTFLFPYSTERAVFWITCYGLGLLATQHFAPRSIIVLGLMFFVTGCTLLAGFFFFFPFVPEAHPSPLTASWLMAATFGGFHLAYAAAVWAFGEEKLPEPIGTENV